MTDDKTPRLPDGRPIMPPPVVSLRQAADRLSVSTNEIRRMIKSGGLKASPSGAGVYVTSLNLVVRRTDRSKRKPTKPTKPDSATAAEARAERRDAQRIAAMERAHARRAQKGYGLPKDGLSSRPSSGGLPTLGRRGR